MRPTRLNARLPIAAALGAAIAATALIGAARAQEDGRSFEQNIIHNVLTSLGLKDPNAVQPTYEQRPPLVIPKNDSQLPPPQKPGAAIASNPAWPKDPDVLRAKELAKREKNRDTFAEIEREMNPLPPDQLGPRSAPPGVGRPTGGGSASSEGGSLMSPTQLGYKGGLLGNMFGKDKEEETARFTGEPARTSLTEPPPGYRTPSPDQPYGVGKSYEPPNKDNSYLTKPVGEF
jgi:hypothetical protein